MPRALLACIPGDRVLRSSRCRNRRIGGWLILQFSSLRHLHMAGISTLPKLDRTRASDSVFDVLRERILTRVFRPGQRLDVRALAHQLGVSATPVKDAVNRLAAEGLIEIRPRSGTFVAGLTPQTVAEIFEIRRALECLAAETLGARLTPDLLARFAAIVEALDRPVSTDRERLQHERQNVELHTLLIEASGNRRLAELYRNLNAHLTIARIHLRRRPDQTRLAEERREHHAILEAIESRDAARLVAVLDHHIRRAGQALVEDLTEL
ncbi:MAG: FCD domain-containing protein [Luteitalea sp.]|nr:FCD domain-containing protein [Luteitalea sp.]